MAYDPRGAGLNGGKTMRRPTLAAMVLALTLALLGPMAAGQAQEAVASEAPASEAPASEAPGAARAGATEPAARNETPIYALYVAMGALGGYVYAAAPVTTTAVLTAVTGGIVTLWAYDTFFAGSKADEAP